MNSLSKLACIVVIANLGACTSGPLTRHVTLDDGRPPVARSSSAPAVVVIQANVPDLIDRPQLVFRTVGNQVILSDQYRWAEPLRHAIPRVIAGDLGELLDSSRVAALPAEDVGFTVDFKLALDFQKLDAITGKGVDVDVIWRLEHRSGKSFVGRSSFRQPLAAAETDQQVLVATQREALRKVAVDIAKAVSKDKSP